MPFTSKLYKKLFLSTFKGAEKKIIFRGHKFFVPTTDTTIVPSMISGEYESYELDIFNQFLKKGATVLDIGANIGVYAIEAAAAIGKKGWVYAFEPVPANQKLLKRNLSLNKTRNVIVVPKAVGPRITKLKIFLAKNNIGTHSAGVKSDKFVEVPVITIDAFVKKNKLKVDMVKMDIEGYEGFAVEGGIKTLGSQKPVLFTEFSATNLSRCGYDPAKHAKNLLGLYEYCYVVGERKKSIRRITKSSQLVKLANDNLILSPQELKT